MGSKIWAKVINLKKMKILTSDVDISNKIESELLMETRLMDADMQKLNQKDTIADKPLKNISSTHTGRITKKIRAGVSFEELKAHEIQYMLIN